MRNRIILICSSLESLLSTQLNSLKYCLLSIKFQQKWNITHYFTTIHHRNIRDIGSQHFIAQTSFIVRNFSSVSFHIHFQTCTAEKIQLETKLQGKYIHLFYLEDKINRFFTFLDIKVNLRIKVNNNKYTCSNLYYNLNVSQFRHRIVVKQLDQLCILMLYVNAVVGHAVQCSRGVVLSSPDRGKRKCKTHPLIMSTVDPGGSLTAVTLSREITACGRQTGNWLKSVQTLHFPRHAIRWLLQITFEMCLLWECNCFRRRLAVLVFKRAISQRIRRVSLIRH